MSPVGFEPTISAGEWLQIDCIATVTGMKIYVMCQFKSLSLSLSFCAVFTKFVADLTSV